MAQSRSLSALIEREIRTTCNRRHLQSMPDLKPQSDLPDRFRDLLSLLDRAELQGR